MCLTRIALEMREVTVFSLNVMLWIMIGLAIVLAIAAHIADQHMLSVIDDELETYKCLLLRTPPLAFVDDMFGQLAHADFTPMGGSQAVFQTSPDALRVHAGADARAELSVLINADVMSNSNLYYTIKLMRSGQSSLIYEPRLPVPVVLVGFAANGREADSFALICKNLSAEQCDNEQVEEAKKGTENLTPQEMLTKIANHDPRFSVAVATVLVMNIMHFRS
jgi:hypothetical protein